MDTMTEASENAAGVTTGMVEVSKAEFFAVMGPRDVHPRATQDFSVWETPNREVIGHSEPGYKAPTGKPERFFVKSSLAPSAA